MYIFTLVAALVTFPGALLYDVCPEVKRVENFQLDKYVEGDWFEIGRAQNNWEKSGDCAILTHETLNNGTTTFEVTTIINNKPNIVSGIIQLGDDSNGTGLIEYISPSYIDYVGTDVIPVDVTAIEYHRYAIVYHCNFDEKLQQKHHYFWILGRSTTFDDATRAEVTEIIKDSKMYDMKHLKIVNFSKDKCEIK